MKQSKYKKFLFTGCLVATLICGYQSISIHAKALLAQQLISKAWQQTLTAGESVKPWAWADTWPVMRLQFPNGSQQYVLHGIHGQALAFGPAHMSASAPPGKGREIVIAAHRDTHFTELKHVVLGDEIRLEDTQQQVHNYRVISARIVDTNKEKLYLDNTQESLRLITCYPFDAINPGGPLRYEIIAIPSDQQIQVTESDNLSSNLQTRL